jgi:hypothetical protein
MNRSLSSIRAAALLLFFATHSRAADAIRVTVLNSLEIARPSETIAVGWDEIVKLMPEAQPDHIVVLVEGAGIIPSQFTNFNPDAKPAHYDEVLFQHWFKAGEKSAVFYIVKSTDPEAPFPPKVFARYVPERLDDFAWETGRVAHRIYGPGLDTAAAGKSRMISSGIDVWCKRVPWLIVDRWYLRGHDAYHKDNGEGLDMYDVGPSRGVGGTGIWDGKKLHVSRNWKSWKVLANGPVRAVFELTYEPWDAGGDVMVSETKRFTVDAEQFLDRIESTFEFKSPSGELTAAIGVAKHKKLETEVSTGAHGEWLSLWENYGENGKLGTAVLRMPADKAWLAEDEQNHLLLAKVKSGVPLVYYAGAGWSKQGEFASKEKWNAYLDAFAKRVASPVVVEKLEAE